MNWEYELFEKLPDGSPLWHAHVVGIETARLELTELGKDTANECFAIHLRTKEIVLGVNVRRSDRQNSETAEKQGSLPTLNQCALVQLKPRPRTVSPPLLSGHQTN